jgi:integral membrane protein (TIGR01906 family)
MKYLGKLSFVLISATVPIILGTLSLLLLLSPLFMNLEYRRSNFPADPYGFTTEERLNYGNATRRYLITGMSLDELGELRLPNGEKLYIDRELSHLEDVKIVLQGVLRVFFGAAVILIAGSLIARNRGSWKELLTAVARGGKWTAGLIIALLLFILVSFQNLFVYFHRIFFEGDSWLFSFSDSLIRLFPLQFWQDIFLVFGLATLGGGIILGWLLPRIFRVKAK